MLSTPLRANTVHGSKSNLSLLPTVLLMLPALTFLSHFQANSPWGSGGGFPTKG